MSFLLLNTLRGLSTPEKIKYFTTNFDATRMSVDESYVLESLIENLQNEMSFTEDSIDKLSAVIDRSYSELGQARRTA